MTGTCCFHRVVRVIPAVAAVLALLLVSMAPAQQSALGSIDEDCTAFTIGRDGRVAFATQHVFNQHKFMIQRDDFWVSDMGKGKKKILNGEKLVRGEGGFSYTVRSLRWSPDGSKLTAELLTSTEAEHHGEAQQGSMTFLLDANGMEIHVGDGDSMIPDSTNAAWMDDESTVVYLGDETRPRAQFSIQTVHTTGGEPQRLFPDAVFMAVAWEEHLRRAVAVEPPVDSRGRPQLVQLDLEKQTEKPLAVLQGFAGQLRLSPSGQRVAYFRDLETLEVRDLSNPDRVISKVQALVGPYFWTKDERHLLLKSGPDHRSGIIQAIRLQDGNTEDMFHGLTFWNFGVSADGSRIGLTPPGKHVVNLFALEPLR